MRCGRKPCEEFSDHPDSVAFRAMVLRRASRNSCPPITKVRRDPVIARFVKWHMPLWEAGLRRRHATVYLPNCRYSRNAWFSVRYCRNNWSVSTLSPHKSLASIFVSTMHSTTHRLVFARHPSATHEFS